MSADQNGESKKTTTTTANQQESQKDRKIAYIKHKINDEIKFWAKYTTFHGVPIIFRAPTLPFKLFWLALFLVSTGLCCFMLTRNFAEFFSYRVSTVIRTRPMKMLRFPVVTVCSCEFLSSFNPDQYIKDHFRENFNASVESLEDVIGVFANSSDFYNEIEWMIMSAFLRAANNKTFVDSLRPNPDEVFYKIEIGDKIINSFDNTSIEPFFDPNYGACFRINYKPGLNPDFDITNVNTGLHLELYTGEPSAFSLGFCKGFNIEIKYHDGYPNLFRSNDIDVGKHTNIIINPEVSRMLPRPFSDCATDLDAYKSPMTDVMKNIGIVYRREACLDIYSQIKISQDHGCYYSRMIEIPNYPPCNRSINSDIDLMAYQFVNGSQVCPIECESKQYSLEISTEDYPTRNHAKLMMISMVERLKNRANVKRGISNNLTYQQIKERFASVYIRFDSLSLDQKIEEPAVPFMMFIANIGGTVGLFLALSFLSVIEIFDLGIFIVLISYKVFMRKDIP